MLPRIWKKKEGWGKVPSRVKFSMMAHACNKLRSVKVEIAQKKFIVSV